MQLLVRDFGKQGLAQLGDLHEQTQNWTLNVAAHGSRAGFRTLIYTAHTALEEVAASHNSIFKSFSTEEILLTYNLLPESMFCPLTAELLVLHPERHAPLCAPALCYMPQNILRSRYRLTSVLDVVSALGVLWIPNTDKGSVEHHTGLNLMLSKAKGRISIIILAQSNCPPEVK